MDILWGNDACTNRGTTLVVPFVWSKSLFSDLLHAARFFCIIKAAHAAFFVLMIVNK